MSEIKLYQTTEKVLELMPSSVGFEKELQTLVEKNMNVFFGVTFLKSEFVIDGGRMDSLGLDENYSPIIFEYKRSINENVINQGLFYLDWLMGHKKDYEWVVMEALGKDVAKKIDWSAPTVVCIASDFTKYDIYAVNQISRNIKLVKYIRYGKDFVLFEQVNSPKTGSSNNMGLNSTGSASPAIHYTTQEELLPKIPSKIRDLFKEICAFIELIDEELDAVQLKYYKAYKKIQNVICIEAHKEKVILYLKLDPTKEKLVRGFSRDVSKIGHYGTGSLEISISDEAQFEEAKPIIERAIREA